MNQADALIQEAIFYEINHQQWHKGLWDSLTLHVDAIEAQLIRAIEYSNKYPNSPDASNGVKALSTILNSVTNSYRAHDILKANIR